MQSICMIEGVNFDKYNPEEDWNWKRIIQCPKAEMLNKCVGVYTFTLCDEPVYIGSSTNLLSRLQTHIMSIYRGYKYLQPRNFDLRKYYYLNKYIDKVKFQVLDIYDNDISKEQLEKHEYDFISIYNPIFNIRHKDGVRRWYGTEQDVDDFVNGISTIDNLKNRFNRTK